MLSVLNDDHSSTTFVVGVLERVFDRETAIQIMHRVHDDGIAEYGYIRVGEDQSHTGPQPCCDASWLGTSATGKHHVSIILEI